MSAVSSSDAWAVGSYSVGHGERTLIEHWDGSEWSIVPSPGRASALALDSVSGLSSTDAWAVGWYNGTSTSKTLIEHWDGTAWTRVPSPNPGSVANLSAVSMVSSSAGWAVGWFANAAQTHYLTLIVRWDGTKWTKVPSPNPGKAAESYLNGVAALSPSSAWAVGEYLSATGVSSTLIQHWNGTAWTRVHSPNPGADSNHLMGWRWARSRVPGPSATPTRPPDRTGTS